MIKYGHNNAIQPSGAAFSPSGPTSYHSHLNTNSTSNSRDNTSKRLARDYDKFSPIR